MEPVGRNFRLGLLTEGLWGFATGFVNPFTILPLAAHDLGRSVADAGLLEALIFAGMNVVQLGAAFAFPASWTEPKKTAWMHLPAISMTLAAGLSLFLPLPPSARWVLLLACVTGHWVCLGFVVPHWASLSSRNIPDGLLGRYFGWCFALAGLAGAMSGALAARWAALGGLAWGYSACFGAAFLLQVASVCALSQTRPLKPLPDPVPPLRAFLKARLRQFRSQKVWLYFGLLVVLLQAATGSTQLFTSFLKDNGFRTADFELFNPVLALGAMLGSAGLGWLMDRRGPRAALTAGLLPLLAGLGFLYWGHGLGAASLAFIGAGVFNAVFGAVLLPWMLRLAEPGQQPAFTGLYSTLSAPWNFLAPWLLGHLAARAGYGPAFGVSAAAALACLLALGAMGGE